MNNPLKTRALTTLFFFSLIFSASAAIAKTSSDVNYRKVTIANDSIWANVEVEKTIHASPEKVWAVISDLANWPKWLPMNSRFELLSNDSLDVITPEIAADKPAVDAIAKKYPSTDYKVSYSGDQQVVAVEEYDMPWPIQNEWVVRLYKFDESNDQMNATWKKLDSTLPDDDGGWEVVPTEDTNETLFKYHYRVKVKKGVPKPVFKTAISVVVGSMVRSLETEIRKRK